MSLAGGGGTGAYDIARDAFGAFYVTTGATVTRIFGGAVYPLGHFPGDYPFPTDIAADPYGGVLVNGVFTGAGQIFRIQLARGALRGPVVRPVVQPDVPPAGRPLGGR
jgi:hypothetical protein